MFKMLLSSAVVTLLAAQPVYGLTDNDKKERKICKPVQETASRIGNTKMCMTASQWKAYRKGQKHNPDGQTFYQEQTLTTSDTAAGTPVPML